MPDGPSMSDTQAQEVSLARRENSDRSFWIEGSRDRYGDAYFVSRDRVTGAWVLWRNNRPYAANTRVGEIEWPITWDGVDVLVQEGSHA